MADEQIPPVEVLDAGSGPLLYRIAVPPPELPPVPVHALEAALDAARAAARRGGPARGRSFRFAHTGRTEPDMEAADFTISDRDARNWAEAVDATAGLGTLAGLSLCLRLLALIDLVGRASWAAPYLRRGPDGPRLDRGLLRAAARSDLTAEAGFNEASFQRNLAGARPVTPPGSTAFTGVSS